MITTDIKELANSDGLPAISKEASDYLLVVFTFEYLKMSGVLDSMRMNGISESFISGYVEGVFSALQTIDRLANQQDLYE
ncbi:phage protein [Yersinia enterocolitica]|uniref:phage protein n=1 Tax=Yersinia enterocolitica TaxID=630 RepID=UPI003D7A636F